MRYHRKHGKDEFRTAKATFRVCKENSLGLFSIFEAVFD